ncbi:hypothetical protein BDD12DRAFT_891556 [Trichophaea hybrida]|nr:hypothetical protein BDD12DRAFT_891556 [Trichophaea hybrida]
MSPTYTWKCRPCSVENHSSTNKCENCNLERRPIRFLPQSKTFYNIVTNAETDSRVVIAAQMRSGPRIVLTPRVDIELPFASTVLYDIDLRGMYDIELSVGEIRSIHGRPGPSTDGPLLHTKSERTGPPMDDQMDRRWS